MLLWPDPRSPGPTVRGFQWKPPCIPGSAVSIGAELHCVLGGGIDSYKWCDQNCDLWLIRTFKVCLGAAFGASAGGNVFPGTENCPPAGGFAAESAIGPVEGSLGVGDGRLIPGGGVSQGPMTVKATTCYYWVVTKKKIGRCD